jgi:NitT/TauT family transport system ATP-binding protein
MEVKFDKVSKVFPLNDASGTITALEEISFTVKKHEFVCLLGPSGCGKSTLLKILAGLEVPDRGSVIVDGEEVKIPHPSRGMVFQDYALFPWLTVEKNISFGLELNGMDKKEIKEIVTRFINMVGLMGFETAYPRQLSGGMKQRVGLARVLAMSPKVLLLDEPFAALDSFTRMEMQEELINLWQQNSFTTIFVTHDIEEAVYLADRIIVMSSRPGKIKTIVSVTQTRPRQRADYVLTEIRNYVLEQYEHSRGFTAEYAI